MSDEAFVTVISLEIGVALGGLVFFGLALLVSFVKDKIRARHDKRHPYVSRIHCFEENLPPITFHQCAT